MVPITPHYRGIDRVLLASDLYIKQYKKEYDSLLDMYYEYLSETMRMPSKEGLSTLVGICKEFNKYGISCEMIAFDTIPQSTIWGYSLNYLGIDVVHKLSESLINVHKDPALSRYFNKNGLLDSENDAYEIIPFFDHGNVDWKPCYVYEIVGVRE